MTFSSFSPPFQAATPLTLCFPAKIFMTALNQVRALLHICLKERQPLALSSTSKLNMNF